MKLTTMAVLEAQKSELQRSTTLTRTERDAALLANALNRSILEMLEVKSLEEAEDLIPHLQAKAAEADRLEREIAQIEAEMEATRIQQEKTRANDE